MGLGRSGFEIFFANELSPMAGETFAYNILNEDIEKCVAEGKTPTSTLWIKSNFKNLKERLNENPLSTREGKFSDLNFKVDLNKKLLIGNIDDLLEFFIQQPKLIESLKKKDIDLMSGGPPCQSFSLAGKREKNNEKNQLPLSFSRFAGLIKPKAILLENVKGITSPFMEDGEKFFAWLEVSKAFALEGFVPICMMLNSKYFGVAQNRPRFILIAYREDVFREIYKRNKDNKVLSLSQEFYEKTALNRNSPENIGIKEFKYYDIETSPDLFDGIILPKLTHSERQFVHAGEAINDIRKTRLAYTINHTPGKYACSINDLFYKEMPFKSTIKNHEPRKHDFTVEARFRFYQVIEQFQNGLKKGAVDLFTGKNVSKELQKELIEEFTHYSLLFKDKKGRKVLMFPDKISEVEELIKSIPTKKHSQRSLREFEPAPAQLTIPDDLCHYDSEELRTLTVREMARFQSFPDWYEFKSKVTTGGSMRKFQVPQYTQVGNAVPPLLAYRIGETIRNTLLSIKDGKSNKN